ncbi:MAG: ribokinase, partial [Phycisphaeraceae bacterium]
MRILNFGSLNIDHVFDVTRIVRPGETIASHGYRTFAGGKGANQSFALARAGAAVCHAGRVGADGRWLCEKLAAVGVDVSPVVVDDAHSTGQAIIQVDAAGENAIVLHAGTNHRIDRDQIERTLADFSDGDVLLLQNEVSHMAEMIDAGRRRGMTVVFNPAPMTEAVHDYPLEQVDVLIVNESESRALSGRDDARAILEMRPAGQTVVLTLGAAGVCCRGGDGRLVEAASPRVEPVDTTAAGDTFIGYFLA